MPAIKFPECSKLGIAVCRACISEQREQRIAGAVTAHIERKFARKVGRGHLEAVLAVYASKPDTQAHIHDTATNRRIDSR